MPNQNQILRLNNQIQELARNPEGLTPKALRYKILGREPKRDLTARELGRLRKIQSEFEGLQSERQFGFPFLATLDDALWLAELLQDTAGRIQGIVGETVDRTE